MSCHLDIKHDNISKFQFRTTCLDAALARAGFVRHLFPDPRAAERTGFNALTHVSFRSLLLDIFSDLCTAALTDTEEDGAGPDGIQGGGFAC